MPAARDQLFRSPADRYRLNREFGRGGMTTVLPARNIKPDRPQALKVPHAALDASRRNPIFNRLLAVR
jgi:serine/threonine protein kinase